MVPKKKSSTRRVIPQKLWAEVKRLFASEKDGGQDLVAFLARRGHAVTQAQIDRKAKAEGWISGARVREIRQAAEAALAERLCEEVRGRLSTWEGQARLIAREANLILRFTQQQRTTDPSRSMNAKTLRTVATTLSLAQEMEARAIGFDIFRGLPFSHIEPDVTETPQQNTVIIREYTEDEIEKVRRDAEEAFAEAYGRWRSDAT